MCVASAFAGWHHEASERHRRRGVVRRFAAVWRQRHVGACFRRWVEHADERVRMRGLVNQILDRWRHEKIA